MRAETRARHTDGSWRWMEHSVRAAFDDPVIKGIITNARNVTERKNMEEALRHQALHDPLTGLPNRTLLRDRLDQALLTVARRPPDAASPANRGTVALLLLDLDRFKEVNDTFGHQYGDLLLRQVAGRLRDLLPPSGVVARLGGDEFAILLPGSDENAATIMAPTVRAALDAPFVVERQALRIGVSVGIALNPACGASVDADTLLRQADIAMYTAKRDDEDYAVYAPALDAYTPQRLTLITDLRQAIVDDALFLHYQPKCDTATGRVESVEALARWRLPHRGLIPPGEFIPLAETTGLIGPLTRWALGAALAQCRAWQRQGLCLPVAVNLSAATLRDVSLLDTVVQLLDANDVSPTLLRIEVTESVLMADAERAREALSRLAALGVRVSIDDYGTGYSSLSYLTRLPVDEIKIDRSFVQQMNVSPTDAAIVASTVALGHNLGLRVVAEGVEDRETWDRLAAMGCDTIQGYYLSRPLPADALEAWLTARSR